MIVRVCAMSSRFMPPLGQIKEMSPSFAGVLECVTKAECLRSLGGMGRAPCSAGGLI